MSSTSFKFTLDDTKKIQQEVRLLLQAMPLNLREHLMHSFLWSQDKMNDYLSREILLEGDKLKDAYSHLESLLERIASYASDHSDRPFPAYDDWVKNEYQTYRSSLSEDKEDIERLMDEGGVYAPGKTSPVDTMENDTLAHYNHLKSEHEKNQKLSQEAIQLMQSAHYKNLQQQTLLMSKVIIDSAYK